MLHFNLKNAFKELEVLGTARSHGEVLKAGGDWFNDDTGSGWASRNDFTETIAKKAADAATISEKKQFLYTDAGPLQSPRFDVIQAPQIGDLVSKSFNGDSYPVGKIVKISKSYRRIETNSGVVFYRRQRTGSWISGGTWYMVLGVVDERNPSL